MDIKSGRWALVLTLAAAPGCTDPGEVSTTGSTTPATGTDAGTDETPTSGPVTGATDPGDTGPMSDTGGSGDTGDTGDTGEPAEPSGNSLDQAALFTCKDLPAMPPSDLRLLDRYEWTRSVGSWIDTDLSLNPLYALARHRYSTYSDGEVIDPSVLSLYLDVVSGAGVGWTKPKGSAAAIRTVLEDPDLKCFKTDDTPSSECVRYFVQRYLERGSLYQPASAEQIDALQDFAQATLADELGVADRPATISQIAGAAWMMSGALHRHELGAGEADEHGRLRLSDFELAQAVTYALTRTPPGVPSVYRSSQAQFSRGTVDGDLAEFIAAAADGTISDPEVLAALVRPYVGGLDDARRDLVLESGYPTLWDNRGEYWVAFGVRDFFREWLDYADLLIQPPKVEVSATSQWSGFDVERSYQTTIFEASDIRENNLVTQLDDMIARVVADDKDVLAQLLTSRTFYTPATAPHQDKYYGKDMNRVYNVQGITEATREARWIDLPESERAGVLTHPAWLAAHSLSFENDPSVIHRGKWIREDLLCNDIPEIPLDVDAALPVESQGKSARQRIAERIDSDAYCSGCHGLMNPLGYPFEIYNHAGFFRVEDHGGPPDGTSTLMNMPAPELNGPVTSAIDLSARFAASPYVKRCFIRQTFRYFAGREETMHDACSMVALEKAYDDSHGSFAELLIALFNSDSFQYRVPN